MTSIVLTGFMGTGKTSVGRALAALLAWPFIDTDAEIERVTGRTVQQLFAERGEAGFRAVEASVLATVLSTDRHVIATGGGALLSDDSRSLLEGRHRVICLTADFATLETRLNGGAARPLARSTAALLNLLRSRTPVYALFEQVDTSGRTIEEVAMTVALGADGGASLSLEIDECRRSEIAIAADASDRLSGLLDARGLSGQVILVTDRNVALAGIVRGIESQLAEAGRTVTVAELPPGEEHKTLQTLKTLYDTALAQKVERGAVVLGVGGGVVGDVAGMLAATYLRGLHLVLVPTTLLAQVDAAIGGKVGVDLDGVKNLVGAFYPAELIVVDPSLLHTLPESETRNGMAEIVKIAAMRSAPLFAELERFARSPGPEARAQVLPASDVDGHSESPGRHLAGSSIIRQAVQLKVDVVREDPRERGVRAQLNYGHTIGHGVETASAYRIAHGQAVSIGMVAESRLAAIEGWTAPGVADRVDALIGCLGLATRAGNLDRDTIRAAIEHDKKRVDGQTRIAVPEQIGRGTVRTITTAQLDRAIEASLEGTA